VERDVLRRVVRRGGGQERAAVLRKIVPALQIDLERAFAPEHRLEQERADEERVLLEKLLHQERRRARELVRVVAHSLADGPVRELRRQLRHLGGGQEEDLVLPEEGEERARRVDLVLDVADRRDLLE